MPNQLFLSIFFLIFSMNCLGQTFKAGWKNDPDFELRTPDIAETRRVSLALPSAYSRKADCPPVRHQGNYNTCMGYALSSARTLVEVTQTGQKQAFSPLFIYKMSGEDWLNNCQQPISFKVLERVQHIGAAPFHILPQLCVTAIPENAYKAATPYPIKGFNAIIDLKTTFEMCRSRLENIKEALVAGNGVAIGMYLPESFKDAKNVWFCPPHYEKKYYLDSGHAMCVVGYDDKKFSDDGAFEIMNSYGTNWGNDGFIWIRYQDFIRAIGAVYELFPNETFMPQGNIPDLAGKIQLKRVDKGNKSLLKIVSKAKNRGLYPAALQNSCFELVEPLYSGNQFQVLVQNEIPAYLYVFSTDRTQKIEPLFPLGVSALIHAGHEIALPRFDKAITLDHTVGNEYIVVLYSKFELNPNQLKIDLEAAIGDLPTRITTVLGTQLVDNRNVQLSLDETPVSEGTVSVTDKHHSILAMILHFNHL